MPEQKEKLRMIKMKGYKGYVWEGFKKIAENYDKAEFGKNAPKPKEVITTPFKTTYKF